MYLRAGTVSKQAGARRSGGSRLLLFTVPAHHGKAIFSLAYPLGPPTTLAETNKQTERAPVAEVCRCLTVAAV